MPSAGPDTPTERAPRRVKARQNTMDENLGTIDEISGTIGENLGTIGENLGTVSERGFDQRAS
ncbi:hypothetical protein [Gordonia sp. OPL2]|uniref:hypothetical protein n=1 Tax=Gordonia sp. OPL2 TaxID=2486274 RepID=UPI001655B8FA|nr:hypothetical protein [Gordonia sp. OPL2]